MLESIRYNLHSLNFKLNNSVCFDDIEKRGEKFVTFGSAFIGYDPYRTSTG